jgi:trimeric autotransporter adhesin
MTRTSVRLFVCLLPICCVLPMMAQQSVGADSVVPALVKFTGTLNDVDGKPLIGTVGVTFLLYKEQSGGAPLWMETQNVRAEKNGHYSVMLGSATSHGIPPGAFAVGEARWLAVQPSGQAEQARVVLASVPYALKALDAETLGGKPLSAFQLAPPSGDAGSPGSKAQPQAAKTITCSSGTACKKGFVPVFNSTGGAATVSDSLITQSGSTVAVGGSVSASGDMNASGNVGASTVTTAALTGGVNSTMAGTGNGIAAVEGSATATGAAGFTFGVIGQSASDNGRGVFGLAPGASGVGVIGETTGSSGIGVTGKTLNGLGWAFSASGNAQQNRSGGGWAKALVSVHGSGAPYTITHCYNSTLPGSTATTPPCGFNLIEAAYAQYNIDFGFEVDDRFWSVSAVPYYTGGDNGAIIANAWVSALVLGNTVLQVDLYTDGGSRQTTDFTVVIF